MSNFIKPLHITSLGSGSHSPFLIHVAVLGPVSISPEGQVKVTVVFSIAGSLYPATVTVLFADACLRGNPHLPNARSNNACD